MKIGRNVSIFIKKDIRMSINESEVGFSLSQNLWILQ